MNFQLDITGSSGAEKTLALFQRIKPLYSYIKSLDTGCPRKSRHKLGQSTFLQLKAVPGEALSRELSADKTTSSCENECLVPKGNDTPRWPQLTSRDFPLHLTLIRHFVNNLARSACLKVLIHNKYH